jgi:hypothetical protein
VIRAALRSAGYLEPLPSDPRGHTISHNKPPTLPGPDDMASDSDDEPLVPPSTRSRAKHSVT